jgi:hypothetical protein
MLLIYKAIFIGQYFLDLNLESQEAIGPRIMTDVRSGVIESASAGRPLKPGKSAIDKRSRVLYDAVSNSSRDEQMRFGRLPRDVPGGVDPRVLEGVRLLPIARIVDPGEVKREGVL